MIKVYIVKGSTGQWDDYYKWTAKAFLSKQSAETYLNQLNGLKEKIKERSQRVKVKRFAYQHDDRLKERFEQQQKLNAKAGWADDTWEDFYRWTTSNERGQIEDEFQRRCLDKFLVVLDPNCHFDGYVSYGIEELEVDED